MDIDILFRIAAIGILVTVISQILTRAGREDMAMLATVRAGGRAGDGGEHVSDLLNSIRTMFSL